MNRTKQVFRVTAVVTVPALISLSVEATSAEEARKLALESIYENATGEPNVWESRLWNEGEPEPLWSEAEGLLETLEVSDEDGAE